MPLDRRALLRAALVAPTAAGAAGCGQPPPPGGRAVASPAASPGLGTPTAPGPAATTTATPATTATPGGPAVEVVSGSRQAPRVALTFHGAGDPGLATQLLVEAERAGAALTVLAVGTWLAAEPAMARRILDGGHELGNHTWSHQVINRLGAAAAQAEISRCADILTRLTGGPGRWFRPSGATHATPLVLRLAGATGYRTSLSFDVDPLDYADPGARAVATRVAAAVRPGSIVSLHLGHPGTVAALPAILDDLRGKGLAAVTVSKLLDG